jgi:3-vinyl bacteriochlorophyllide hydratase
MQQFQPQVLYTPEQRARRDATKWTLVQGVLAPVQFLIFLVSLYLVLNSLKTGEHTDWALASVVIKTLVLYAIMITGSIWEKVVYGKYLFAHAFFWEDVVSMVVLALHTAYLWVWWQGQWSSADQLWLALAAVLPLLVAAGNRLLALQLPLVGFALLALLPLWSLGDSLRGAPVRQMAAAVVRHRRPQESLAMVGVLKPSLHYYTRQVVLYEGNQPRNLANLAERLRLERRRGQRPSSSTDQPTVLVVIDQRTANLSHWLGLRPELLQRSGIYQLWRLQRHALDQRAARLDRSGVSPDWQQPRAERY